MLKLVGAGVQEEGPPPGVVTTKRHHCANAGRKGGTRKVSLSLLSRPSSDVLPVLPSGQTPAKPEYEGALITVLKSWFPRQKAA